MTSRHWQRVEDLVNAALACAVEDRAAFLTTACRDDDELRREVESLLAQEQRAPAFMSAPPLPISLSEVFDRAQGRLTGHRVGAYTIGTLIGAGGMGDVYRAVDVRLAREVAIKVLPAAFSADPDRRARFEREARMLATLNHPHIGAIYGFEDADGVRALVLELVDGQTLAERIASTAPLSITEALAIARQIAEALDAAHEKGLVHRDLKPANIKITPNGVVKVLDFGLAKPARNDRSDQYSSEARSGAILGTAAYMSPEQARGQTVDKRGDIWAFGCVLYEMLSGCLAFAGDTASDTIAKILEREPDWSKLPARTPPSIRRLLHRCLVKNLNQRLRDIGDVRIEIDECSEDQSAGLDGEAPRADARTRATWLPWLAGAAIGAGITVWAAGRVRDTPAQPLADAQFSLFTNWEGSEEGAEISPDGKLVAFLSDRDGEYDIWVSQIGTGFFHNLTRNIPPLASSGFVVRKIGFSADSSQLWFNPGDGQPPMLMPVTGGTPRPFLPAGTNTPAWSPDGRSLVYIDKANRDDPIYVADASGADAHQIFGPGPLKNMNPVWSPDSHWIYFGRGSEPQEDSEIDVWRLRPSGGSPERITTQPLAINFLAPLDAQHFLFVARAADRSGPWLWSLDVATGVSTRVPSGADHYPSISASRDGRRLVATIANPSGGLWQVPISDRIVDDRDAQPYTLPEPTGLAFAPRIGADSLFYLSERGTGDGLWKAKDGKALQLRRGVDGALSEPPAVSPDGSQVIVVIHRDGKRHLLIMSADGTNAHTLAASIDVDGAAGQSAVDWSPDGTRIVVSGRDEKGPALFVIPVDSGRPARLLEGQWLNPVWSPTDDVILYAGRSLIGQVQLLGVHPSGAPVELPKLLVRPGGYRFLPDGSGFVYLERIPSLNFSFFDLTAKTSRPLTRLGNHGALRTFDITRDGKYVVFDRFRQNSNIVLIDRPK
jgi:Tol biopolymer transport system component